MAALIFWTEIVFVLMVLTFWEDKENENA